MSLVLINHIPVIFNLIHLPTKEKKNKYVMCLIGLNSSGYFWLVDKGEKYEHSVIFIEYKWGCWIDEGIVVGPVNCKYQ